MNPTECFDHHFQIVIPDSDKLIREAYRLRYVEYCIENTIFDPKDYTDCLEKDIYDLRSVHRLITHKPTGSVVAYVRLVLADSVNPFSRLPIEKYCGHVFYKERIKAIHLRRSALAEISRFTISRNRLLEVIAYERKRRNLPTIYAKNKGLLVFNTIALGLYKAVFDMAMENKIEYCYAVMEPSLLRLLGRFGISFQPIGSLVDYHGKRIPCGGAAASLLSHLHRSHPEIWDFLIQGSQAVYLKNEERTYRLNQMKSQ